jgi:hypothetical protein
MRTPFDHLGKKIGQQALGRFGPTVVQHAILPEIQYADLLHEPDPARDADRSHLGLLGQLVSTRCVIELYSGTPGSADLRACVGKHIAFWQKLARDARTTREPQQAAGAAEPFLWVIAAGTPKALLAKLALTPATGWPAGVYLFGSDVIRVGIVAASELPRERSTLLVRLMAAGPLLRHAIAELGALPPDATERVLAEPVLLRLQHELGLVPDPTSEEQEFIDAMYSTWENAREQGLEQGREIGLEQGREVGRAEARAGDVLTVLRARGVAVPDGARARILAERDPDRLERWLERASVAVSLAEVLDEPG